MAELAGLAAGREPEGVDPPPVPVQLPYEADPGTLTHWCIAKTRGSTCPEIFGALIAMNAKYPQGARRRCLGVGVTRILPYDDDTS